MILTLWNLLVVLVPKQSLLLIDLESNAVGTLSVNRFVLVARNERNGESVVHMILWLLINRNDPLVLVPKRSLILVDLESIVLVLVWKHWKPSTFDKSKRSFGLGSKTITNLG